MKISEWTVSLKRINYTKKKSKNNSLTSKIKIKENQTTIAL